LPAAPGSPARSKHEFFLGMRESIVPMWEGNSRRSDDELRLLPVSSVR
jgi:hypothetical protein